MHRLLSLSAFLLLSAALTPAQEPATSAPMPPGYRGVSRHIPGIFVTPIAGAPFSATVKIVSHDKLPNGTEHVVKTDVAIARSSTGRIYNERRHLVPADFTGEPRLLSAHIYDPTSRQSIYLDPAVHLAREVTLRAPEHIPTAALPPSAATRPREGETESSLGTKAMDGLELTGSERRRTVPATESGTGQPIVITDEYWYSPELSIYMLIRHNDPRTGEQLVAVTDLQRAEPPAERFTVPTGYKIVDETTDESPIARQ